MELKGFRISKFGDQSSFRVVIGHSLRSLYEIDLLKTNYSKYLPYLHNINEHNGKYITQVGDQALSVYRTCKT